jgi:hypothetical protein
MQDTAQITLSYEIGVASDLNFWKDRKEEVREVIVFVFPELLIPFPAYLTSLNTRAPPFILFQNFKSIRGLRSASVLSPFLCLKGGF